MSTTTQTESANGRLAVPVTVRRRSFLESTLLGQFAGEYIGTFILIVLGNGAVAAAILTGSLDGWAVALMWGLGVTFAVYVAGSISGAHLNPAVTVAMTIFRGFPAGRIPVYVAGQFLGAFTASAVLFGLWRGFWPKYLADNGLEIGGPGSQKLMAMFACFYPNPGVGVDESAMSMIGTAGAFWAEAFLTLILLLMILALTAPENPGLPQAGLGPVFIGLTVSATIGIGGPLTMDAINPVRDLAPRTFAWLAGFGEIAFPGPRGNEWWIYILGPLTGAILGGAVYRFVLQRFVGKNNQ